MFKPNLITHFYSDPHFGHERAVEMSNRPFTDVEHMNEQLIHRYWEVVAPDDCVCWVGDCFFTKADEAESILRSLPGRKILVRGNHDRKPGRMAALGFDLVVEPEMVMHIGNRKVRVCHYPPRGYGRKGDNRFPDRMPMRNKGEVFIHGHTHQREQVVGPCVHVGVDAWAYAPVTFEEVESLVLGI